jgi:hypothetical protein
MPWICRCIVRCLICYLDHGFSNGVLVLRPLPPWASRLSGSPFCAALVPILCKTRVFVGLSVCSQVGILFVEYQFITRMLVCRFATANHLCEELYGLQCMYSDTTIGLSDRMVSYWRPTPYLANYHSNSEDNNNYLLATTTTL